MPDEAQMYTVEERGDELVLVRSNPEMPQTPEESMKLARFKSQIQTTDDGEILIPEAVRDRLDAGPGDEIHLQVFLYAWAASFREEVTEALKPLASATADALESISDAFSDIDTTMDPDDPR